MKRINLLYGIDWSAGTDDPSGRSHFLYPFLKLLFRSPF